jgi:hypothetical protein
VSAIESDLHAQLNALRDEAYRLAHSWLAMQPHAWRPMDHIIQQIAPELGREYTRIAQSVVADSDPTGATGCEALAWEALTRLVAEEGYEMQTDRDGGMVFARVARAARLDESTGTLP